MNEPIEATQFSDFDAIVEHEMGIIAARAREILYEMKGEGYDVDWYSRAHAEAVPVAFAAAFRERAELFKQAEKIKNMGKTRKEQS